MLKHSSYCKIHNSVSLTSRTLITDEVESDRLQYNVMNTEGFGLLCTNYSGYNSHKYTCACRRRRPSLGTRLFVHTCTCTDPRQGRTQTIAHLSGLNACNATAPRVSTLVLFVKTRHQSKWPLWMLHNASY